MGGFDFGELFRVLGVKLIHHLESVGLLYSENLPSTRSTSLNLFSLIKDLDGRDGFELRSNERDWLAMEFSLFGVPRIISRRS